MVVIATGVNNPENYKEDWDSIVKNLPKGHHMILVTPYEGDKTKETYAIVEKSAAYIRELAENTPYITVADWNQVAKEHPEIWVGTDQVHFGSDTSKIEEGAKLYADTIATALQTAQDKPVKSKLLVLKREELEKSSSFKISLENRSIPFTNELEKFIM